LASDPFVPKDGRVDVARVMAALREGIRARREEAVYGGTSAEQAVAERLRMLADRDELDPELLDHILSGEGRWNLTADYRILTHRRGPQAWLVVGLKRLVRPFVRLYTDPIVQRQRQLNLYLLSVCQSLFDEVIRLQQAASGLKARCDRLEAGSRPSGKDDLGRP
jgi:hypothetical protein